MWGKWLRARAGVCGVRILRHPRAGQGGWPPHPHSSAHTRIQLVSTQISSQSKSPPPPARKSPFRSGRDPGRPAAPGPSVSLA